MPKNPKLAVPNGGTVTVDFEQREPHSGQSAHGPWYLWTVTQGNERFSLFAGQTPSRNSPSYSQIDAALGVSMRVGIHHAGDSAWVVEPDGVAPLPPPPGGSPAAPTTGSPYADMVALATRCMLDAKKIVAETCDDVQGDHIGAVERMAVYLAINCDKRNITLDSISKESSDDLPF